MKRAHRMPFGAELVAGGARFRLWAPDQPQVTLKLHGARPARIAMEAGGDGFHSALVQGAHAGTRYGYEIAGGAEVPDPASRFQPEGPHGPSEIVDPEAHDWRDADWAGRPFEEIVLYEIHVGAFTRGGHYRDVLAELDGLAALGVTALELMPLAECPGARNWGYDGTHLFAPECAYGRPEELKQLVEAAHGRGLSVFLDVVYNHFGPEGNYLGQLASPFFTDRHRTPWGAAIDYEGPESRHVRDFVIQNALYWIDEYHLDGLRLDAVHAIHDASRPDLLEELAARVRERSDRLRPIHLVLENDANEARRLVRDVKGAPCSYTAQWNDDLHHALHVIATGESGGYYAEYADDPVGHLGRALATGFAFQGEPSRHRGGAVRGEPSGSLPPTAFVSFLQNHDQVGNRAFGERLCHLAPPEAMRAVTALLLLSPGIPLLFMGEEWAAPEPFPFFCDFGPELAAAVREGRRREFASFPAFRDPEALARVPDAGAPETFERAVLDRSHRSEPAHAEVLALHRQLLAIRHREVVPRLPGMGGHAGRFLRIGGRALAVDWQLGDGSLLSLVANLGPCAFRPPGRTGPVAAGTRRVFEIPRGTAAAAESGILPPWSIAFWLGPAPAASP